MLAFDGTFQKSRMSKDGISKLVCCPTHEVKPFKSFYKENDILYEIFSEGPGLNTDFMRTVADKV